MALKRPENFVAYHSEVAERGQALVRLNQVDDALRTARVVTAINNLRARRTALEWQALLDQADEHFQQRRYEEALAGYQRLSQKLLELLEPKVGGFKLPRTWLEGTEITRAFVQASASLLNHLVPEEHEASLVLATEFEPINLDKLGTEPTSTVSVTPRVSDDVLDMAERAAGAMEQGRWNEAAQLYEAILRGPGGNDLQLQADVFLNLGALEVQRNRPEDALRFLKRAQGLFQENGDQIGAAEALHNSGLAHLRAGQGTEALQMLEAAQKAAGEATLLGLLDTGERRPSAPPSGIAPSATNLGSLAVLRGRLSIAGESSAASLIRTPTATSRDLDTERLAEALGSHDLTLKLRPVNKDTALADVKLTTPAQEKYEDFGRSMTLFAGDEPVTLNWQRGERLQGEALFGVYQNRIQAQQIDRLGFVVRTPEETIVNLPHLYHLVLPIKMGDCYHHLGNYPAAQDSYLRASRYELINLRLEAPDLWRRLAENAVAWGDSLYREELTEDALPIYGLLMTPDSEPADSFFYTAASLMPTGQTVTAWLQAVRDEAELPDLNPAIAHLLHTVRKRWAYINAGLDFFGNVAHVVSPFTFRYLQEVARYFAQRAIQAEQRYLDFYTRFESGLMTRRDLENTNELAQLGVEVAEQNELAAAATLDATNAGVNLANIRHQNAQDQLNKFNDVAWELESLAGHIARGSAWTGGDLPNLHYSAGGRYDFEGSKHEVLQQLTVRQTHISNDLQRARMQDTIAELNAARGVANAQRDIAQARLNATRIETDIAEQRRDHAQDMLDAFNDQKFNPEQWLAMAGIMQWLSNTALDRAIEVARLMEKAYNFENFDNRRVIRSSYKLAWTQDMLGGEILLSDIDSFTHYHVTRVREKPIPVKWALSLPEEYPGQFLEFTRTGRMEFDIDLQRVALAFPGTYRHQVAGVEVEVDGFLPPTGLYGRLTNSGLGRYRDISGNSQLRLQPAETVMLSQYSRRQDAIILTPPQEMRALFEGNSVASGWTLETPRALNDADLNLVFDIRLVLYFECLFDHDLFAGDAEPAHVNFDRTRALYLRQHFPDAYYQLRETGQATLELTARDFPHNQHQPVLRSLALAFVPSGGASLTGVDLAVQYPGQGAPVDVTISDQQMVSKDNLPLNGDPTAFGQYEIELNPAQQVRKDEIDDLVLVLEYHYTPAP